ncbi:MAG: DUF5606 domain-containing protein [Dysgonamonadaceae bacterium]|jgi:hypothetical protein|nr:DUF5606 domain-containing protein [Dysgonamonadaceae bacterium]
MLKEILSVSGKPGLYKLISQGKSMFVVESLIDHKRGPVYMRDKVVSLGDISIYTETEDIPLRKVLQKIKEKQNGEAIDRNPATMTPEELKSWFAEILPDFDKGRVYPSDIKKAMSWYNLLIKEGLTDFEEDEPADETASSETTETPEEPENNL